MERSAEQVLQARNEILDILGRGGVMAEVEMRTVVEPMRFWTSEAIRALVDDLLAEKAIERVLIGHMQMYRLRRMPTDE